MGAPPAQYTHDLATYTLPALLYYERLAEQGLRLLVLFPNDVLAPLAPAPIIARPCNARSTITVPTCTASLLPTGGPRSPGIGLHTPQEGIEELEFAVKTLGLKVINIPGGIRRPIRAIADKYPARDHPDVARHARYIDFLGITDKEYDYDPFWARRSLPARRAGPGGTSAAAANVLPSPSTQSAVRSA